MSGPPAVAVVPGRVVLPEGPADGLRRIAPLACGVLVLPVRFRSGRAARVALSVLASAGDELVAAQGAVGITEEVALLAALFVLAFRHVEGTSRVGVALRIEHHGTERHGGGSKVLYLL